MRAVMGSAGAAAKAALAERATRARERVRREMRCMGVFRGLTERLAITLPFQAVCSARERCLRLRHPVLCTVKKTCPTKRLRTHHRCVMWRTVRCQGPGKRQKMLLIK